MKNVLRHIKWLLLAIFTAGMLSCVYEEYVDGGTEFETIEFTITVPESGTASTRALNDDDECRIEELDVLQFRRDKFAYRAVPSYSGITHTGNTYTFSVRMMKGDDQDIVVIANAKDKLNSVAGSWNTTTTTQDALDDLDMDIFATDKIAGNVIMRLPMFGVKKDQIISESSDFTGGNSIKLVRMVAKVELELTTLAATGSGSDDDTYTGSDNSNFQITEIYLYNQPIEGWVAPDVASWPVTGGENVENVATTPWYGGNAAPAKAVYSYDLLTGESGDRPVQYTGTTDSVTNNAVHNSIYTFEAPKGEPGTGSYKTNTCIVMGGRYKGSTVNSYYRIDFEKPSGYIDLLRNHNYVVKVQSVTGEGYDKPEEAFENNKVNITAIVVDWKDEEIETEL